MSQLRGDVHGIPALAGVLSLSPKQLPRSFCLGGSGWTLPGRSWQHSAHSLFGVKQHLCTLLCHQFYFGGEDLQQVQLGILPPYLGLLFLGAKLFAFWGPSCHSRMRAVRSLPLYLGFFSLGTK